MVPPRFLSRQARETRSSAPGWIGAERAILAGGFAAAANRGEAPPCRSANCGGTRRGLSAIYRGKRRPHVPPAMVWHG